MLVKVLSDIHLEAAPFRYIDHGEHVCILAGDIGEGMRGISWALKSIPEHILTLYIKGNHELYGQDAVYLKRKMQEHNKLNTHVRVLDNEIFRYNDIDFFGTTLWTDFNLYGNAPLHGEAWRKGLNDSLYILNKGRKITIQNFIDWNKESLDFLEKAVSSESKTRVLITHYCFELSVSQRYRNDPLTPGFATKIPMHIHEKFDFHFHGHTHDAFNYEMPYGTKVICNPKGYGMENSIGFNEELVLDI